MEITREKKENVLLVRLAGRLDAGWCDPVQRELDAAVRDGEHHIHLDMARVDYISSAGLAVILGVYKQLYAIKGEFGIAAASPFVESVFKLAGLSSLIQAPANAPASGPSETTRTAESASATYTIFEQQVAPMKLRVVGEANVLQRGGGSSATEAIRFDKERFALGIGALGQEYADSETRLGEFLAASGVAAFQPSDASNRPDFVVSEAELVPEGHLLLGLLGQGGFAQLARFEARKEARSVGLSELAAQALEISGAQAVAIVGVTETLGLVGATLRRSPAPAQSKGGRFDFPTIREWLAFTNEPIHRDSTSLVVGVAAREGSPFQELLRPLGGGLFGHFHAAAFPYRPLQKGRIELESTVAALFEARSLTAVLHLLTDSRELTGTGESQFLRGALWIAPATPTDQP